MKHPILLNIQQQFPTVVQKRGSPANCRYRIPYAQKTTWWAESFRIVEQDYDAKDAYVSLIEINTKQTLSFIVTTTLPDLFWLYQLEGEIHIQKHPKALAHNGFLDRLSEDQYALLYSPPRQYRITVQPGHHILFFFVVNSEWLWRHPIVEPTHFQKLVKHLQHKKDVYSSTKVMPIHDAVRKEILHLLTMRDFGSILMDTKLYAPIIKLVLISRKDLQNNKKPFGSKTKSLLIHIREYCKTQIAKGTLPSNREIAQHFKRSEQYIARIHKQEYGETLQHFQIVKRLQLCRQEIRETDKSQTEIAYHFGFSDLSHFISQYQRHFEITPSEERLRMKKEE